MSLWGKTDKADSRPKFVKVNANGVVASDASGKKLVFLDAAEAEVNTAKGVQGPGWYLILTTGTGATQRTRAELLIAIADAPVSAEDDSDAVETDAELEQPMVLDDPTE